MQALKAKEQTEIAGEKEIVQVSAFEAQYNNKDMTLVEEEFQIAMDNNTSEGETEVEDVGEEFEVIFWEKNRYYTVDKDGQLLEGGEIIEDKNPGDITTGKDGEELDGSKEHPYEIWCIEDFIEWSDNYNKYSKANIKLCRNLNFKSKISYADSNSISYGDINNDNSVKPLIQEMQEGEGFNPIEFFSGTFDGNNKSLKNIYVHKARRNVGFFSALSSSARILNLLINGEIINDSTFVGGIAGSISTEGGGGIIDNCHNFCNIKGKSYAGGLIGYIGNGAKINKISNCSNSGNINSEEGYTGGIVANTDSEVLIIENCYNKGKIRGPGITGNNKSIIKNCYNSGEVTYGLVGANQNRIENSYNVGKCSTNYIVENNIYPNSYIYKCFYDEDTATDLAKNSKQNGIDITCKSMNKDEMKRNEFIEELNKNETEEIEIWKKDIKT